MTIQQPPEEKPALRRVEDHLKAALVASRIATWQWDPATDSVVASEAMDSLFGLPPGESFASGAHGFRLVHPEDRENHRALVEAATRSQGGWHDEFRIIRPVDGRVAWLEERANGVRNAHTGRFQIVGVVWDITERKHAEEALRESEARQAFLLQLGDRLRRLSDPYELMNAACEALARQLRVAAVQYSLVEPDQDMAEIAAVCNDGRLPRLTVGHRLRLSDHGPAWAAALRSGSDVFSESGEKGAATAVPLIKGGRLVAWMSAAHPQPRAWSEGDRLLHREVAERTWAAVERARAEEAVRRSEEKYRMLFASIDEGFCIQEVIFDDLDRAIDLRYLEVNRAFEQLTGLQGAVGRTAHQMLLDMQASWLRVQAEVARTGEAVRFENYVSAWDKWFDVYSFRIGQPSEHKVASVFTDITLRRRTEDRLRQAADFDAFRVALNDALRPLEDPGEIQAVAAKVLGERLRVNRAFYVVENEPDGDYFNVKPGYHTPNVSNEARRYRVAEVGGTLLDELRAGRVVVVPSVESERRFTRAERNAYLAHGVRAYVELPLIKAGRLAAILTVQQKRRRDWTPDDLARIEETAQRTWAAVDRARAEAALREWERRLQKAFSIETVGVLFFTLDGRIIEANAAFERMSGYARDELLRHTHGETLTPPEFLEVTRRAAAELATRGETAPFETQLVRKDGGRWWGLFAATRLKGAGAVSECVEFVLDITESKRTEEELRRAREDLEARVTERTHELAETNASLREQMAERRRAEAARQELLRQLVNAQEGERRRISRELHDELGQQVSALMLKLSMMRQDATVPPEIRKQLEALEKIARETDNGLDFLVWQLRPTALDDLGLVAALGDYVHTWALHFGIQAKLIAPGEAMRLDAEIETVLYRVAQEALNNVAKHAHAKHVELKLERGASHASLTVVDDGVGFDPAKAARDARGLGLVGMRERAGFIGGSLVVRSKPGKGARVKVDVPLT